jgi:DNA ligase-1
MFKPMLASNAPREVRFPVYVSPKIDGIRAVVHEGVVKSRTMKDIPNRYVQHYLACGDLDGLDGELTVGAANDKNVMQRTMSGVMSRDGEPDFTFWVFDAFCEMNRVYSERLESLESLEQYWKLRQMASPRVKILKQTLVHSEQELNEYEMETLAHGYEGVMLRSPLGPYKQGRSTPTEGYLSKLKRFSDAEAVVVGKDELIRNGNVPGGTLGALRVRDLVTGVEFCIGTGFTSEQRDELWSRTDLVGEFVKYKFFEIGVKDAPRFPVFLGFRDPLDMGE